MVQGSDLHLGHGRILRLHGEAEESREHLSLRIPSRGINHNTTKPGANVASTWYKFIPHGFKKQENYGRFVKPYN
jgi:hypothetical protein